MKLMLALSPIKFFLGARMPCLWLFLFFKLSDPTYFNVLCRENLGIKPVVSSTVLPLEQRSIWMARPYMLV